MTTTIIVPVLRSLNRRKYFPTASPFRDSFFPFLQKSHDALSTPTKVSSKSGLISRVLVIRKLGANTFASDCIGDCTQGRAAIRYVDVEVGVGGERISSY